MAGIPWSKEELNILNYWYPIEGTNCVDKLPNRTKKSINVKASNLKLGTIKHKSSVSNDHEYKNNIPNSNIICLDKYINTRTKISHKCLVCDHIWLVTPANILAFRGCPQCANQISEFLYIVYFPDLQLYKVGITKDIKRRQKEFGYKSEILICKKFDSNVANLEKLIMSKVTLFDTGLLHTGNTETFITEIIDEIINIVASHTSSGT